MHHMAWIASVAPPPVKREVDEKMGEMVSYIFIYVYFLITSFVENILS